MPTVNITINGTATNVEAGQSILDIARAQNVEIPTLCHDPRLPAFGSCLVCVVELRNAGRLVMSCTTPVANGMDIWTHSPPAIQARKDALELLMSSHNADCRGACYTKCPANVDVQGYLALAGAGMFLEALELIRETNPMPLACGRICVRYCEASCRRKDVDSPGAINFMKRYVADLEYDRLPSPETTAKNGKKVAVVGGGPAGLTCAYYLVKKGYDVTLFEQQPKLGGMLRYGIPEYRLPEAVLDKEISYLLAHGITAKTGVRLGVDVSLADMRGGHDAVFLGLGSWKAKSLGVEGERHPRVLPGIDFLGTVKRDGPPKLTGRVAIVGGGNTALDAARTALRCGASAVTVLYRRSRKEMPADPMEVDDAIEEGVIFEYLVAPKIVITEGEALVGLKCSRMELSGPDSSGRRKPVEVPNSDFLFEADWIISAIGQDQELSSISGLNGESIALTRWNSIAADESTWMTNIPGIFAGGDVVSGPSAAIDAIGAGRRAAVVMDAYLQGESTAIPKEFLSKQFAARNELAEIHTKPRAEMPKLGGSARINSWDEVDTGLLSSQVAQESARCLSCGCSSVFDCTLKDLAGEYCVEQAHFAGKVIPYKVDDRHPNIVLDNNKCILCARCVRYCGELIGIHALGFVNRGYETAVKPTLGRSLHETSCISCGNCIEVCPTGAISAKPFGARPGPIKTKSQDSVCTACSMVCELEVHHAGPKFFYVRAKPQSKYVEGELCAKGRFGIGELQSRPRIMSPLKGKSICSLDEASGEFISALRSFSPNEILFLVGGGVSHELAYAVGSFARREGYSNLLTRQAFPYLERLQTTMRVEDAKNILLIGSHLPDLNPVLWFKVRRAVERGANLVVLGGLEKPYSAIAHATLGQNGHESAAFSNLLGALDAQASAAEFQQAARLLRDSGGQLLPTIAIVATDFPSQGELTRFEKLFGSAGCVWFAGADANAEGVNEVWRRAGIVTRESDKAARLALESAKIKAFVAICPPATLEISSVQWLCTFERFQTAWSERANLVIPMAHTVEEEGFVRSLDGRDLHFHPVFSPPSGFDNIDFWTSAMKRLGDSQFDRKAVRRELMRLFPAYALSNSSAAVAESLAP